MFAAKHKGSFDSDLMSGIIKFIEETQSELKLKIKLQKKGELILMVYEDYIDAPEIDYARVIQLVKLAA